MPADNGEVTIKPVATQDDCDVCSNLRPSMLENNKGVDAMLTLTEESCKTGKPVRLCKTCLADLLEFVKGLH